MPPPHPFRENGYIAGTLTSHATGFAPTLKTISRYVLKAHLGPLIFGLGLIIFVLVIDVILQMMDQVLSKGLSFGEAGRLFFFNLAWIIALAVPMAVLISVLMAFGKLAADNEILAAKACGVGFFDLLRPILGAAAILTALMVWFNDQVLPDWNHEARNIASNLKRRKAAVVLKEKEGIFIHKLSKYSLLVRDVDERNNRLRGITVYDNSRPGHPTTLHAPAGMVQIFDDGSYIRLTLEDGEYTQIHADDPARFVRGRFDRQVVHIRDKGRELSQYRSSYRSDREMDISAMYGAVAKERKQRDRHRVMLDSTVLDYFASLDAAASAEAPSIEAEASEPSNDQAAEAERVRSYVERTRRSIEMRDHRINEFLVEIHKKFSIPFACIVFVLVGAPIGCLIRQRGVAVSVGVSLLFFLVYWMFLIGGEELADRGFLSPALSMWAPNLVFGLLGIMLSYSAAVDRPFGTWPLPPWPFRTGAGP